MVNSLGTLNGSGHGALPRGKYQVTLKVLFDLDKKPFLTEQETARALEIHAKQLSFDKRQELHSHSAAHEKASVDLDKYARGEISELPESREYLQTRYHRVREAIRYAHVDWVKTSGISALCAPIFHRALELGQRKFDRAFEREKQVAQALQIPFEPSESALAIARTIDALRMTLVRVQHLADNIDDSTRLSHILKEFVDWSAAEKP